MTIGGSSAIVLPSEGVQMPHGNTCQMVPHGAPVPFHLGYLPLPVVMQEPASAGCTVKPHSFMPAPCSPDMVLAMASQLKFAATQLRAQAHASQDSEMCVAAKEQQNADATRSSEDVSLGLTLEEQDTYECKPDLLVPFLDHLCSTVSAGDMYTTIMIRNLPNDYSRDMLLDLLDSEFFACRYNFVYLPVDFHGWVGFGYAFVNMVSHFDAECARIHFHEFSKWKGDSKKVCEVCWAEPFQGFEVHVERFRNSPIMHESVPDHVKPLIFQQGRIMDFPPPTKRIQPPRKKWFRSRSKYGRAGAI